MKESIHISRREFVTSLAKTAALASVAGGAATSLFNAAARGQGRRRAIGERVQFQATPFPLDQVRLLDGMFLDAAKINQAYLHSVPEERLLHTFRLNAGLPSTAEPLGGWEAPDCELRGHFTGHFLSACALSYASLGDDGLKAKGESIVAGLAKCQKAHGNGYLSAFPEDFFDRLQAGKDVWAPFYTLHKIMAGLVDMYTNCKTAQALEVANGLGGWVGHYTGALSDDEMQRILLTEYGGMMEALLNLSAADGRFQFFGTARRFEQPSFFDPLAEHRDNLKGLHVNTNIPKVIGAARRYELTGEPHYREIASYFWNEVTKERCYATGGTSNAEYWRTDPGDLSTELSDVSEECCCGYNMLKLTRHVYQWTADPRCMDYYERTLFNSRFGTMDPEGMKMYYLPLQTGYWKYYNSRYNSFWCCTGTGAEEFSKMGDSIYFHNEKDVFVNLFIASEVKWPEKGLTIRQDTKYPAQDGTKISIEAANPVDAAIHLRIPGWAFEGGEARVNGEPLPAFASPGSYLNVERTWKQGDTIELKFKMPIHAETLPGDPTQQAAMYGPIVLAGRLGTKDLTKQMQYDADTGETDQAPQVGKAEGSSDIATENPQQVRAIDWVERAQGEPLEFRTVGQKTETSLKPLYQIAGERYAVYWKVSKRA
jgi:uncharacterized protein